MNSVVIERCPDYNEEAVKKALDKIFSELGGIEKYVQKGTRVVLKPNLVMKKKPEEAATTHPAIVKVISRMIIAAGGMVTIADSPGGLYTERFLKGIYMQCGIEEAARASGAKLNYDLAEVEVENPSGKFLKKVTVIKPLIDADLVINLPKLKTHGMMVYTGAVKNMFGAIAGVSKAEYHIRMPQYNEFADVLIDIFSSVKPTLNIMDAVIGMEGDGPTSGIPKQIGLVMAGENAFSLDLTAANVVGIDPQDIPILKQSIERGLCSADLKDIRIIGQCVEKIKIERFDVPQLENLRTVQFFDKGILRFAVNSLKPKPYFKYNHCIGCADCAKNCPAHIIEMNNRKPKVDLSKCIRCFCCQELCPAKAVVIKRPLMAKILTKVLKK